MMRIVRPGLMLLIPLLLGACPRSGAGPLAQRGYQRGAPVIAALERFRVDRGAYPDSLRELVPAFLPESALRVPDARRERFPLLYERTAGGYELGFRYVGPGMNTCTYTPATARWKCSGYM